LHNHLLLSFSVQRSEHCKGRVNNNSFLFTYCPLRPQLWV
jgi:hypothetical protein